MRRNSIINYLLGVSKSHVFIHVYQCLMYHSKEENTESKIRGVWTPLTQCLWAPLSLLEPTWHPTLLYHYGAQSCCLCIFPRIMALASLCMKTEKQPSLGGAWQARVKEAFDLKIDLDGLHLELVSLLSFSFCTWSLIQLNMCDWNHLQDNSVQVSFSGAVG